MARLGVQYFAPKWLRPFYDLTIRTKKPTTAFVFWPRLEIHVGSGPELFPSTIKTNTPAYVGYIYDLKFFFYIPA